MQCRLKGKGLKLLHHYPDQLWAMGDKSVPNAGFTPGRIFPQVKHTGHPSFTCSCSAAHVCGYMGSAGMDIQVRVSVNGFGVCLKCTHDSSLHTASHGHW